MGLRSGISVSDNNKILVNPNLIIGIFFNIKEMNVSEFLNIFLLFKDRERLQVLQTVQNSAENMRQVGCMFNI